MLKYIDPSGHFFGIIFGFIGGIFGGIGGFFGGIGGLGCVAKPLIWEMSVNMNFYESGT